VLKGKSRECVWLVTAVSAMALLAVFPLRRAVFLVAALVPGLPGTVAIAGHRTTYLAPFRRLDEMRRGDLIVIETPYARLLYRTEKQRIVLPTAYRFVTHRMRYDRLALTACHPIYSASRRIVVFGRLVSMEGRGRARVHLRL
jgi:sortase A